VRTSAASSCKGASRGIPWRRKWNWQTIDVLKAAAMKSERSLRLAASAQASWTSCLDDNSRFANVVMPHIDDAHRLARWLTGNSTDAEDVGRMRHCAHSAPSEVSPAAAPAPGC
jgi:hypothetical protein